MWENGKRIKIFDDKQVELINKGKYEIAPLFADPVASSAPIKSGRSFKRPLGFDEALANVMTLSEKFN